MIVLGIMLAGFLAYALYAVSGTLVVTMNATETPTAAQAPFAQTGSSLVTSGLNVNKTFNANSNPNATVVAYGTVTMVAGAGSINLAAVGALGGGTQDLTGLKVRAILLKAKVANANPITVAKGAANGYTGCGAAFSASLAPGQSLTIETDTTVVAAGTRTFDVTGTGTQQVDYEIYAGTN